MEHATSDTLGLLAGRTQNLETRHLTMTTAKVCMEYYLLSLFYFS